MKLISVAVPVSGWKFTVKSEGQRVEIQHNVTRNPESTRKWIKILMMREHKSILKC